MPSPMRRPNLGAAVDDRQQRDPVRPPRAGCGSWLVVVAVLAALVGLVALILAGLLGSTPS